MELVNKDMDILKKIYEVLDERKANDIQIIDIRGLSVMTDYFLVASASNINHVHALSEHVDDELRKLGHHYSHIEGYKNGNWILMDYGDFVIHIFDNESRSFYDIERLWRDGKQLSFV